MRYLIAMAAAIVLALLATLFVGGPFANLVVDRFTFESPDEVADLHTAVFMGTSVVALLIGWAIGWTLGGRLTARDGPS
jgi:hypothetical protein